MHRMYTPHSPSNTRLTITVSEEVHDVFKRMAKASGTSLSRCMGEWLADTIDGAAFVAQKMEEARAAPRMVAREMHAYALGLADETQSLIKAVKHKAAQTDRAAHGKRSAAAAGRSETPIPPPCNTGGKVPPGKGKKGKGEKS